MNLTELKLYYTSILQNSRPINELTYQEAIRQASDRVTAQRNLYVLEVMEGLAPEDLNKILEIRQQLDKLYQDPEIKRIQYAYKLRNAEIQWMIELAGNTNDDQEKTRSL